MADSILNPYDYFLRTHFDKEIRNTAKEEREKEEREKEEAKLLLLEETCNY